MKVNLGCGPHHADGWLNVDVAPEVEPDLCADVLTGLPIEDGAAEAVYLGHVLEHVPWDQVPVFLAEVARIVAPDGRVMVVGPDVDRALDLVLAGTADRDLLTTTWESDQAFMVESEPWDQARHAWNCSEDRVARAMDAAGFDRVLSFTRAIGALEGQGWPLVSGVAWQFATLYYPKGNR